MKYLYVLVRPPGKSFLKAISSKDQSKNIDLEKALFQHRKYCEVLENLGLTIIKLPADEKFPDGCFVEDPFVIFKDSALVTNLSASSRKGEGERIYKVIKHFKKIKKMSHPSTMDGGDVMLTPRKIFIGQSKRTNLQGIQQLESICNTEVERVRVERCLHLKTGVTYLGKDIVLLSNLIDEKYFKDFNIIHVPEEEIYAANCLNINDVVLIPKGCFYVRKHIQNIGFETVELEMSEFKKADGGLTCLSLLF